MSGFPPMFQSPTLSATWRGLLDSFRPAFRRSRTFGLFVVLATGLVARPARRAVVGMLAGTGMAAAVSFHACCRFLLPSRLGRRPDRADAGPADRFSAAARRRADRRGCLTTRCFAGGGERCSARSGPTTAPRSSAWRLPTVRHLRRASEHAVVHRLTRRELARYRMPWNRPPR
jgi:hypothetical protein